MIIPAEFEAELESHIEDRLIFLRSDREAKRLMAAEEQADVDFDALYLDRDQLDQMPVAEPLIAEVLPRHSYCILRGRDQTFKSFLALDWSLSLAAGRPWHGKPAERVKVLYIAGEGAYGIKPRVAAWEEHNRVSVEPGWFTLRTQALNMYAPGAAFEHLLTHVAERGYGLIVVDTLRKVSGSADGNGSDMGVVVDNLLLLKDATDGGSVLVPAHTTKGDTDVRGFSGIEDDADVVWHADREENTPRVKFTLTKMKDGPDGITIHAQQHLVGDSMVLVPATPGQKGEGRALSNAAQLILQTMRDAFRDGAHSGALRKATGLADSTYYHALDALKAAKMIANEGSAQRPFYVLTDIGVNTPSVADTLTAPTDSNVPETTSDLQVSNDSNATPTPIAHFLQLQRPLGSWSAGAESQTTGENEGDSSPAPGEPGPEKPPAAEPNPEAAAILAQLLDKPTHERPMP